jgi:hypothetical protein
MYCGGHVEGPPLANTPIATPAPSQRPAPTYDEDELRETSSNSTPLIVGVICAVVAVVAIAIVAGKARSHKSDKIDSRAEKKTGSTTGASTTTLDFVATKASKPASADSVAITSCRCSFGDGQSTPLITLTLQAPPLSEPTRSLSLGIERKSGFMSESNAKWLSLLPGAALAPLDGGTISNPIGVACDPGVYVLVANRTATGWSSVNASWKWNVTLPAAIALGADAGAPMQPPGTAFTSYCTPLTVQNGSTTFALANGKRATLSVQDGKLR